MDLVSLGLLLLHVMSVSKFIFAFEAGADSEYKRLMHIKVFPLFWACLLHSLQTLVLLCIFQLLICDGVLILYVIGQVALREHKDDRCAHNGVLDLSLPLLDAGIWDLVIDGDTDHEDIGALVLGLPVDTQMVISTRIVDLNLYLTAFDVLCALVHIQHSRLILLRELIVEVVVDQARFTDGGVAHEDDFYFLLAIGRGGLGCLVILDGRLRIFFLAYRRFWLLVIISVCGCDWDLILFWRSTCIKLFRLLDCSSLWCRVTHGFSWAFV